MEEESRCRRRLEVLDMLGKRAARAHTVIDAVAFLAEQTKSYQEAGRGDAAQLAAGDFCQVLLGLNEFIYVD